MAEAGKGAHDANTNNNNNTYKVSEPAVHRRLKTHQSDREPSLVYDSTVFVPRKQSRTSPVRTHTSIAAEEIKQTQASMRDASKTAGEKILENRVVHNDKPDRGMTPPPNIAVPSVYVVDDAGIKTVEGPVGTEVNAADFGETVAPECNTSPLVNGSYATTIPDVSEMSDLDGKTVAITPSAPHEYSNHNSKLKEGVILSSEGLIDKFDTGNALSKPRADSITVTVVNSTVPQPTSHTEGAEPEVATENVVHRSEEKEPQHANFNAETPDNVEHRPEIEEPKHTHFDEEAADSVVHRPEKKEQKHAHFDEEPHFMSDPQNKETDTAEAKGDSASVTDAAQCSKTNSLDTGDTTQDATSGTPISNKGPDDLGEPNHVEYRSSDKPRGELRHALSEVLPNELQTRRRSQTMANVKEHAYGRLQEELSKAQEELKLKDEECEKLLKVRDQMGEELEELTASLFEEANNMVQDANIKRMHSEKLLKEASEQIEVLQAEVVALKQLVLTSTPSSPNKHLHPQIDSPKVTENGKKEKPKSTKPFWKTHRRSTSHHEFTKEARQQVELQQEAKTDRCKEVDPVSYDEFVEWRASPSMNIDTPFLSRIYVEDIGPCLNFSNVALAERLKGCVANNTLTIEPIPGDNSYARKCRLTDVSKLCNYKIKLGEDQEWYSISLLCRNRIAAVCDFYTYLRYIHQGLVKGEDNDLFYEIVRLRKEIALARLGYT